jgi:hypothetical protein
MKRLMSREMLRELISLIEPHKDNHQELYEYLMITWTACHYDSTYKKVLMYNLNY